MVDEEKAGLLGTASFVAMPLVVETTLLEETLLLVGTALSLEMPLLLETPLTETLMGSCSLVSGLFIRIEACLIGRKGVGSEKEWEMETRRRRKGVVVEGNTGIAVINAMLGSALTTKTTKVVGGCLYNLCQSRKRGRYFC